MQCNLIVTTDSRISNKSISLKVIHITDWQIIFKSLLETHLFDGR